MLNTPDHFKTISDNPVKPYMIGIDCPDIRVIGESSVICVQLLRRAGWDGLPSKAVLYHEKTDKYT